MNSSSKKLNTFLQRISTDYPYITLESSSKTHWDPNSKTVFYNPSSSKVIWSVLHELGHASKNHANYRLDIDLLKMELDAWQTAKDISKKYEVKIDEEYIQDCMDSYRDWLHGRSKCPNCQQTGLQNNDLHYTCLNCGQAWKVTRSKFCRAYRRKIKNT